MPLRDPVAPAVGERRARDPGPHDPDVAPLYWVLLDRSRVACRLLLVEIALVVVLLSYNLAVLLGVVPEWLGPNLPPDAEQLRWPGGELSSIGLVGVRYFVPPVVSGWVWGGFSCMTGVFVWRWAIQVSTVLALHAPSAGRRPPQPLRWVTLLLFAISITAVFAAGHYVTKLWRDSEPGAISVRMGLPVVWCTCFVLRRLEIDPWAPPLVLWILGLVFQLLVLGLGIVLIRRIDARVLQRLEWVRGLRGPEHAG
jgi:hypothetical protein